MVEHNKGFCNQCGSYHKKNEPATTDAFSNWDNPPAPSVQKLLEYDPITGKPAINTAGLKPEQIHWLLFGEGLEVWNTLEATEKERFTIFIQDCWLQAKTSKGQTVAQRFYGNILINIKMGLPIMHGEYSL